MVIREEGMWCLWRQCMQWDMNGLDIGQGGGKGEVSLLFNSGKNSDKSVALKLHGD